MKPHGHYCKICGRRRANEKFSGSGHAAHICKDCARLPIEKRNELQTLTRIENLPFYLNREQRSWLEKKRKDKREEVREAANWAYDMRFPERQRDCEQIYDQAIPEVAGAIYDKLLDITVQLSDVIDAVEMTYGDLEYFLDKKTGKIISSDDTMFDEELADRIEEHGFFVLPRTFGIYRTMVKFVKTLPDEIQEKLNSALKRKDIVSQFEDMLLQLGLEKQWHVYKEAAYRNKAIKWCEENRIKYE